MDKLIIEGKGHLTGSIDIPGSKNAALPIMVGSLLSEDGLYLNNLPSLQDIYSMKLLLKSFGIKIENINSNFITPGRKRLLSNIKKEEVDWDFNQDYQLNSNAIEGSRVFHQKFGYGKNNMVT